jgi:tRNA pseudouridine55 synthase
MNGLLLVDKPCGMTSFDVVRRVRRWFATRQVGHCGTLDPSATGVLPVAVGSATRLVEYLLSSDKEYQAVMRLGITTDSQDGDGQIIATHPWQDITREDLDLAVSAFVGRIRQVPPMHSALKRDGVPLYRLARQGIEVTREAREVHIGALDIRAVNFPDVALHITCSKGTYIRTLCHDLGLKLGCGAYMSSLRRTRCGLFSVDLCHPVEQLEKLAATNTPLPLLAPEAMLANWPGVEVHSGAALRLAHGIAPALQDVSVEEELIENTPVRLLVAGQLAAVACYAPGHPAGRGGDFQLWKVFPAVFSIP